MNNSIVSVFTYTDKEIRTVMIDGEAWFVAKDVCDMLEIGNSRDALNRLPDSMKAMSVLPTQFGDKEMNIINEAGVYKLAFSSRKPEAESFTEFVAGTILPSIRKTGSYSAKGTTNVCTLGSGLNIKALPSVNHAVSLLHKTFKIAGGNPVSLGNMVVSLYRGIGVPVPALEAPVQSTYLSASQIADKLGIMSKSGKPHAQLVSGIIDQIDVPEELTQIMTFEQNGHSGTMIQYKPEVMILVEKYLYDSDFPLMFNLRDRNYQVQYRR